MVRVVVATTEVLGERMAGPAIRAWQMARTLATAHDVTLVTTTTCTLDGDGSFAVRRILGSEAAALTARSDVWVVAPGVLPVLPDVAAADVPMVVDLYDPSHLEHLELHPERSLRQRTDDVHNAAAVLNGALRRGDLFLVASARQRDFWLGALASLGRVNPVSYAADPTLRALVAISPFGLEAEPPRPGPALRGVLPGIDVDDFVLLWGGGLYNWLDPATLIRAVGRLRDEHPRVRLVFLGAGHPNPRVPAMRVAAAARELADRLDLTGKHVFFNANWVPYDRRGAYLLDADVGVSTHLDHIETTFSFRTRVLDYLWAGLPVVATAGDVLTDAVSSAGAGLAVPPGDVEALTAALATYAASSSRRRAAADASRQLARSYGWDHALAPLSAFCAHPRRAPDLGDERVSTLLGRPYDTVRATTPGPAGWRGEVALLRSYLEDGGPALVARRARSRLSKLARGRTD